jgi:hypothetical protein
MLKNTIYFLVLALFVSACTLEPEEFEASKGTADFTKTIFIGNSLTAGFRDGELYRSGQMESFPSIIAQSLIESGLMSSFKQPLIPDELGFGERLKMDYTSDCQGNINLGPVPYGGTADSAGTAANISVEGPFQNLGVPGAQVTHIDYPGYGSAEGNRYFARFASNPMATILDEALDQDPTFAVVWIGNNDVLGFATSGGVAPITDAGVFEVSLTNIIDKLHTAGAKGIMCNIPDVTSTAFFTTVPYNAIPLTRQGQVDSLMAGYAQYNAGATQYNLPTIEFTIGANAMVIEDNNPPYDALGGLRQIKSNELVLLTIPQDSIKCFGWGTQVPVPEEYVLTEDELTEINTATAAFNTSINTVADNFGWGVTDINGFLDNIAANGLRIEGKNYTTTFGTGNLFSLDGIHLTGNGNAIVANEIIETINTTYNASIPKAMVSIYTGIELP